jgi:hypothetical protein
MGAVLERKASASQDRGALAKMVMTLLEHWKLTTEDQAALLGIASIVQPSRAIAKGTLLELIVISSKE